MHVINGTVGQSNVVQDVVHFLVRNFSPNGALDEVANLRSFLDSCAALGTKMENELTVVAAREEIPTKEWR